MINIDVWFSVWLSTIRTAELDFIMLFFSNLVSYTVIFMILFLIWFMGRNKLFRQLLIALVIDAFLMLGLKLAIGRPRPYEFLPVFSQEEFLSSFPSSHASRAFVLAGFIGSHYKQFRIVLYSMAVMVAFSRVYLGVHYLSDVVGGAVVGTIVFYVVSKLNLDEKVFRKIRKPKTRKAKKKKR